jgi:hypothetical protein
MSTYFNTEITEFNNIELYVQGKDITEKILDICKTYKTPIDKKYNIFVYWIGSNVNYKHSVVLKSFLATQNLNNATLKIYSDENIGDNPIFDRYKSFKQIEFHKFDIEEEAKNTIFENFKHNKDIKNHNFNAAYESDFFRLFMLHKYGGFYIDFDILLLRDLSPLLNYDFLYQWGAYPDNKDMINGAVMHFKKDSNANKIASEIILNSTARAGQGSLHWASDLYYQVKSKCPELIIFPAAFFNPEWQHNHNENVAGEFEKPFIKCKRSNELFEGSFTWHWHNKWKDEIEEGSKFDILDKILEEKFLIIQNNEYCNNTRSG